MSARPTRREFLRLTLGVSGAAMLNGCMRSSPLSLPPAARAEGDYKALVCVFLLGGNDSYSMLVPVTPEKYDLYSTARLDLAVPRDQLHGLPGTAADGASYGLHPRCTELAQLFNRGSAALLSNVGSLAFPTLKSDYLARRVPFGLFSHSDQQQQWQTAKADAVLSDGWAGRAADVLSSLNGSNELPLNISIGSSSTLQRGRHSNVFQLAPAGAVQLANLADSGDTAALRASFEALQAGADSEDGFQRTYADNLERGIRINQLLASELEQAPDPAAVFPDGNLGDQLKLVARLISRHHSLGMRRQIFMVSLGGFDTHADQNERLPPLLQQLSQALGAFDKSMSELGLSDRVTAFTASDFGRSLSVNGTGTNHGWGGHQWVLGGAVRGGRIYGQPPSLIIGGDDDSSGGRFIPQTSVDEFASTLLRWFGLSDNDLGYVLPNIGRFASRDLGFLGA